MCGKTGQAVDSNRGPSIGLASETHLQNNHIFKVGKVCSPVFSTIFHSNRSNRQSDFIVSFFQLSPSRNTSWICTCTHLKQFEFSVYQGLGGSQEVECGKAGAGVQWRHLFVNQDTQVFAPSGNGTRHDICQNFYTSDFQTNMKLYPKNAWIAKFLALSKNIFGNNITKWYFLIFLSTYVHVSNQSQCFAWKN